MTFVEIAPYLEGLLALVLGGGWYKTWRTMKQSVKAADLANDASAVALLAQDIERKNDEISRKDERIKYLEDLNSGKDTVIADNNVKMNRGSRQMSRVSNCMCVNMGCWLRDPQIGSGMKWFEENESDFHLGCNYLTIDELMEKKKNQKHG